MAYNMFNSVIEISNLGEMEKGIFPPYNSDKRYRKWQVQLGKIYEEKI